MYELDETDLEILRLLVEDGRRPFNEIADAVGLSPPTVSDRVDRLRELGVIRRFTLELDRGRVADGTSVLVDLHATPGAVDDVRASVAELGAVEHVFVTADGHVLFKAVLPEVDVEKLLADALDDAVREYEVRVLVEETWNPEPRPVALALECDQCGNTVTNEGESLVLEGDRYQFCCPSCRDKFESRWKNLREGTG